MYQENSILRVMVAEMGVRLSQDNIVQAPSDRNILARIDRLEQSLDLQKQHVTDLQAEVKRLKIENQVLTKTITQLVDKNKQLTLENKTLKDDKTKVELESDQLRKKYEQLLKENAALKTQLNAVSKPGDKQEASENNLPGPVLASGKAKEAASLKLPQSCRAEFFSNHHSKDIIKSSSEIILSGRKSLSLMT